MESHPILKVDTSLYVKRFSGRLVYLALYCILASFLVFVLLYILIGTFSALLICCPLFFGSLYRISKIQKKYVPKGWEKKKHARKLPDFILVKRRICQS
jgi:uncharacterized membrane protein